MAISSNRYVNITSSVGGGTLVPTRQLSLRLFSTNNKIPTNSVLEFSSSSLSSSIIDMFGSSSDEYKQAAYYFGFISKVTTSPKTIQFARWADASTDAQVIGSKASALESLKIIEFVGASITVTIGGIGFLATGIDLTSALTYSDVASLLEGYFQSAGITNASVVYNATTQSFDFFTGDIENGEISLDDEGVGLLEALGWGSKASYSAGIAAQSVTDVLSQSVNVNNNFGTYAFVNPLTDLEQIEESAVFANGRNVEYMYLLQVLPSNYSDIVDKINGYASCGLTLNTAQLDGKEYPHLLPAAIAGSANYDKPAASANFMYYQDSRLTASVTSNADADVYDAAEVNYYGQSQEAGVDFSFYQRGVLTGGINSPKKMGIHLNEQWFKSYLKSEFLSMFIALQQVPADLEGEAIGISYLDAGISQALLNGSIAVGKQLTTTQINYITQLTGDSEAWRSVQDRGFWYNLTVDATTNEMSYLIVYSKRDSVDFVDGRHTLI